MKRTRQKRMAREMEAVRGNARKLARAALFAMVHGLAAGAGTALAGGIAWWIQNL